MTINKIALAACVLVATGGGSGPNPYQLGLEIVQRHPESLLGFCVMNTEGVKLQAYNEKLNLAPASSLKAITTATALEVLGQGFRFSTTMYHTGEIDNGVLRGDLLITPAGDPTWGSRYFTSTDTQTFFSAWIDQLKNLGINRVDGSLRTMPMRGDTRHRIPPTWSYMDLGNYYGASLAPLNYMDNTLWLTFNTGEAGSLTTMTAYRPWVPFLRFDNRVVAANIGYDNAYVYGAPGQLERWIGGQLPQHKSGFVIKASFPEPEFPALRGVYLALQRAGITITQAQKTGLSTTPAPADMHLIGSIYSPTLGEIAGITNLESNNLFAEALVNQLGLFSKGEWSTQAGTVAVKECWQKQGIAMVKCNLYDGSGLSRFNGIGAETVCQVLRVMSKKSDFSVFYASLPVAGRSGSIASMFRGSPAEGNLRAKSGYMDKVRSYCGYLNDKEGNRLIFCVMANNYACSALEMRNELEKWMISLCI